MNYETILVESKNDMFVITINRLPQKNSINGQLLEDIISAITEAENNETYHAVVIQGKEGLFCTGMDFEQLTKDVTSGNPISFDAEKYMGLLKRFSSSSKVIISVVDGKVLAGGVGLVAASDIVIASSRSQFGLSEAMWGLLPANVMPFLIRRVGFQKAYYMTLTMQNLSAEKALQINLIDEMSENIEDSLRKLMLTIRRVSAKTVVEAKSFFRKMWIINDEMEKMSIDELLKLVDQDEVKENIKNYVLHNKFPWDK
jgi:polyketide biosynthesis enoyl-CoA hydratase PksH